MTKNYMLITGICAAVLIVGLAPEAATYEVMLGRFTFMVLALIVGYIGLRWRFRQHYCNRFRSAFKAPTHQDKQVTAYFWRINKAEVFKRL